MFKAPVEQAAVRLQLLIWTFCFCVEQLLGGGSHSDASLGLITSEVGELHTSAGTAETLPEELLLITGGHSELLHASAAAFFNGPPYPRSRINNKQTTNRAVSID